MRGNLVSIVSLGALLLLAAGGSLALSFWLAVHAEEKALPLLEGTTTNVPAISQWTPPSSAIAHGTIGTATIEVDTLGMPPQRLEVVLKVPAGLSVAVGSKETSCAASLSVITEGDVLTAACSIQQEVGKQVIQPFTLSYVAAEAGSYPLALLEQSKLEREHATIPILPSLMIITSN